MLPDRRRDLAGPAEQFTSAGVGVLAVDEDDDSCARHSPGKISPRLSCNAGQAGKIEATLSNPLLVDNEQE